MRVFGNEYRVHVQEVIPVRSKAYRAVAVNGITAEAWLQQRDETVVHAGLDVGKDYIYCTLRWGSNDFDRPWRARNPSQVVQLAELLRDIGRGRHLVVALEPTGTYGDALRQALAGVGLVAQRVSPKQASDYAEVFDGVPSQHDGKDAAVVAELAAQGKSWPWPLPQPTEVEQELAYQVDWLDGQRRQMLQWYGRVEALLSRHWPEATAILRLSSATLLRCLTEYGGPRGLAAAPAATERVYAWGRGSLAADKVQALVDSARHTAGVRMGSWDEQRLRRYAHTIQGCRREMQVARRRLAALARDHAVLQAMGTVVGVPTACVLWVELGDPSAYHCGPAYRKALGLNLAERSSGRWQGQLKISKRGSATARRWLYLAAWRWLKKEPVRRWYARQKAARRGEGKPAVIAVMRKLALAVYQVGGRGATLIPRRCTRAWRPRRRSECSGWQGEPRSQRKERAATKLSTTPLSGHLPHLATSAPRGAPSQVSRGRDRGIGEILHGANSMVATRRYIRGKRFGLAEGYGPEEAWAASWSQRDS
jgi:transposase